ncbi:hypothetical protein IP510_11190 [Psychrobacter sp. NG254]|uniref:hypothetical protein n=1 Tax=Psychrobacter sp. NG254 TaxID=2782003 RepID=UPI001887A38E|nr:hypothetical protein [Psychrobacter sp. NG254]MBF2720445.1 hypothetical protein [Psychrobacter sp. NG254]
MSLEVSIIVIIRQMGNQFRYSIEDRQGNYDNVATSHQDKKDATRKAVHDYSKCGGLITQLDLLAML